MRWEVKIGKSEPIIVDLPSDFSRDNWVPIKVQNKTFELQWHSGFNSIFIKDEHGIEHSVKIRSQESSQFPGESHRDCRIEIASPSENLVDRLVTSVEPHVPGGAFRKKEGAEGGATVRSPMVGKIFKILVANGESVTKGQELCIIEAMKMENKILAPCAGVTSDSKISEGQQVGIGELLYKVAPPTKE